MEITSNGVELFYRLEGQGDPALVMHGGLGADHTVFVNSPFNKLANQLKLIYYDHRCNGRSACPDIETMSHDNLAGDAEGLREVLGLGEITVIGHSYGGITGLEYALRYQSNLRRLILITTAPSFETLKEARTVAMKRAPELMPIVKKALSAEVDTDAEFQKILADLAPLYCYNYKQFANKLSEATKDIVPKAQAFRHSFRTLMPQYDVRDELQNITVPVLIICGRHDWITPVSQSLLMHDKLPNSELVIFENSAHWVYIEEETLFLQTVNDWLDRT